MIDAGERLLHSADRWKSMPGGPFDENHRNPQCPGCGNLAVGGAATAVLGDDAVDTVFDEQGLLVSLAERSGRKDVADVGQHQRRIDRVDAANKIRVLRSGFKHGCLLPTDRQEDAPGGRTQRSNGRLYTVDAGPEVARPALPGRAPKGESRYARRPRGYCGVLRNSCSEGVRRIDQKIEAFIPQCAGKAFRAAEPTDPGRDGLRHRRPRATGQRKHHGMPALGKGTGQRAGFRGATENKDMKTHA